MPLATLVLLAATASVASAARASGPYDTALVTIGDVPMSKPAQPDFIGFSLEWKDHIHLLGNCSDAVGVKLSYMRLLRNLQKLNGGAGVAGPRLRLGGNSATVCWYNPNGTLPAPSPAENCFIQPRDFATVFDFLRYSHGPDVGPNTSVTWGLNFYDGWNASFAIAEALALDADSKRYDRNGSLTTGMSYGFEIGVSRPIGRCAAPVSHCANGLCNNSCARNHANEQRTSLSNRTRSTSTRTRGHVGMATGRRRYTGSSGRATRRTSRLRSSSMTRVSSRAPSSQCGILRGTRPSLRH